MNVNNIVDVRVSNNTLCRIIDLSRDNVLQDRAIQALAGREEKSITDLQTLIAHSPKGAEDWARTLLVKAEMGSNLDVIFLKITNITLRKIAGEKILGMAGDAGRNRYAMVSREVPTLQKEAIKRILELGVDDIYDLHAVWPYCSYSQKQTEFNRFVPNSRRGMYLGAELKIVEVLEQNYYPDLTDLAFERLIINPPVSTRAIEQLFSYQSVADRLLVWSKTQIDYVNYLQKAIEDTSLVKEKAWTEYLAYHLKNEFWLSMILDIITNPRYPNRKWVSQKAHDEILNLATSATELSCLLGLEAKWLVEEAARRILAMVPETEPTIEPASTLSA